MVPFDAIWDTGATGSVITPAMVQQLGIEPIDKTMVHRIGSDESDAATEAHVYLVSIAPMSGVLVENVRVVEGIVGPARDQGLLIGMDIISLGDLALTHEQTEDGVRTVFSFIVPWPLQPINYHSAIEEANRRTNEARIRPLRKDARRQQSRKTRRQRLKK